jgi:uncharacterized RDD family membrane protein YckC
MFCTHCGVAIYEGAAFCTACGQPVDPAMRNVLPARVAYAGFWLRLLALILDSLVLAIPTGVVLVFAVAFGGLQLPPADAPLTQMPPMHIFLPMEAIALVVGWLYYALMESSSWQGTLGKRALSIGVTDLQGHRLSFARASGRFFGKLLSGMAFGLGYVMAGFTEKRQALHDTLSGCLVVKMP